jgi:hypothetical protein
MFDAKIHHFKDRARDLTEATRLQSRDMALEYLHKFRSGIAGVAAQVRWTRVSRSHSGLGQLRSARQSRASRARYRSVDCHRWSGACLEDLRCDEA